MQYLTVAKQLGSCHLENFLKIDTLPAVAFYYAKDIIFLNILSELPAVPH